MAKILAKKVFSESSNASYSVNEYFMKQNRSTLQTKKSKCIVFMRNDKRKSRVNRILKSTMLHLRDKERFLKINNKMFKLPINRKEEIKRNNKERKINVTRSEGRKKKQIKEPPTVKIKRKNESKVYPPSIKEVSMKGNINREKEENKEIKKPEILKEELENDSDDKKDELESGRQNIEAIMAVVEELEEQSKLKKNESNISNESFTKITIIKEMLNKIKENKKRTIIKEPKEDKKLHTVSEESLFGWVEDKENFKEMKMENYRINENKQLKIMKFILNENMKIINELYEKHRENIVSYIADVEGKKEENGKADHDDRKSLKSTEELPYESGTSDEEVKPKVIGKSGSFGIEISQKELKPEIESDETNEAFEIDTGLINDVRISIMSDDDNLTISAGSLLSELSDPYDLDDWGAFYRKGKIIKKEEEKIYVEKIPCGLQDIDRELINQILESESSKTSLPSFIYEMFNIGLEIDEFDIQESIREIKEEKEEKEEEIEECILERIESDYQIRSTTEQRLNGLFASLVKDEDDDFEPRKEKDLSYYEWQIIDRRVQNQLDQRTTLFSRSFRTLPSSSIKEEEPYYITELKKIIGPKLKKAITEVLIIRPIRPVRLLIKLLEHYGAEEAYEAKMDAIDHEIRVINDDLYFNKNYAPLRFTILDDLIESEEPSTLPTTIDSALPEDWDPYKFLRKAESVVGEEASSEELLPYISDISIESILTVTSLMTIGSSLYSISSPEEPCDSEIIPLLLTSDIEYDEMLNETLRWPRGYGMHPFIPPPFETDEDGLILFIDGKITADALLQWPRGYDMDPFDPPPFDTGSDTTLINEVNNVLSKIDFDIHKLLWSGKSIENIFDDLSSIQSKLEGDIPVEEDILEENIVEEESVKVYDSDG